MPINLLDVVRHFDNLPWQVEAIKQLDSMLDPGLKRDDSPWVVTWRRDSRPPESDEGLITPELMERLTGYPASSFDHFFCYEMNEALSVSGFDSYLGPLQMLMANLLHESGGFRFLKEIDPGHYLENRTDLGNVNPGDGPRFRGVTPLQVTGRANYQQASDWFKMWRGIDDPKIMELGCDYVADAYPFTFMIPWIQNNNLLDICIKEGFDACCRKINGGWNGYAERCAYYEICKREILTL